MRLQRLHNTGFSRRSSMKLASLLLATAVTATSAYSLQAYASRKSQAQDAKRQAESSLNSVTDDINDITYRQQELQREINALDSELVQLLMNMDILSDELELKDKEIKQANEDLKVAKEEEETQYERMKKRIRYMYERGDGSILEALLGATSMSDFLNRVNYCNEVYDYDRDQLEVYKETKQQVIELKNQLEDEQAEMEEMQDNYKAQEKDLRSMVVQKEATMDNFDSQLAQAKILAAEYKDTIQRQNQIIRDEEEKERIAAERAAAERAAAQAEADRAARETAAAASRQAAQQSSNNGGASNSTGGSSAGSSTDSSSAGSSGSNTGSSTSNSNASPAPSPSNSAPAANASGVTGSDVIAYATQFIGRPYVWGGTSLTNGADCSGFVMSVYAHFGYSLPRTSYQQEHCGRGVSYSEAQPGDIICYSGHVALYMGNGMIVGAQSSRTGIATQNATYRTIIAVRRIIN